MSTQHEDVSVQGLVSRAFDIDCLLALYRAELTCLPADHQVEHTSVREEIEEISDLVTIMEDLWKVVAGRTARLCGEMQAKTVDAQVDDEMASQAERWHRYLAFAAVAGIRVPTLAN